MPDSLLSREKNFRRKERAFKKACQHLVQLEKQLITAKVNYNQNSITSITLSIKKATSELECAKLDFDNELQSYKKFI